MKKPRIILADTDENYLLSLEIKFLEMLGDDIELEVITDGDFFRGKLAQPCSAELLVVSQDLYFSELKKNDIANVFILTEQPEKGNTRDLVEKRIYKYTSPNNIFKQISAGCGGVLDVKGEDARRTKVILVYSPVGGAGKTTLALGISAGLAQNFQKVLYIDAERLAAFPHFFTDSSPVSFGYSGHINMASGNVYDQVRHMIRTEKFDYLPPFQAALSALNLDYSFYRSLIVSACSKRQYDFIVVDTDAVFDSEKAALITLADTAVVVVKQTQDSIRLVNTFMRNIQAGYEDKYLFVCNNFGGDNAEAAPVSDERPNFMISEYVRPIEGINKMSLEELAVQSDIQKVCYLVS